MERISTIRIMTPNPTPKAKGARIEGSRVKVRSQAACKSKQEPGQRGKDRGQQGEKQRARASKSQHSAAGYTCTLSPLPLKSASICVSLAYLGPKLRRCCWCRFRHGESAWWMAPPYL